MIVVVRMGWWVVRWLVRWIVLLWWVCLDGVVGYGYGDISLFQMIVVWYCSVGGKVVIW